MPKDESVPTPLRLNLGAGTTEIPGYTAIDRKLGTEVYPLEYADESVDEIRASHVLEHFPHGAVPEVVSHWIRKLKPGGLLKLAVPDFERISREYLDGKPVNVQGYVMGGQVDMDDIHHAIFDREALAELLYNAGLERMAPWVSGVQDCASLPISLNMLGYKPSSTAREIPRDTVAAVLAAPRYGPILHQRCAHDTFAKLNVPYHITQGCFWNQILSEAMEHQLQNPIEYLITCDFDTVFRRADVVELWRLINSYPEADAICALQSKRGAEHALFGMNVPGCRDLKSVRYKADFQQNITKIESGHFGLTIFRAGRLRTFEHPWMLPRTDSAGRWGDGRMDADMAFWEKWGKHDRTLYLANRVVVGHLEDLISWPAEDYKPQYQSIRDYLIHGPPAEIER